MAIEDFDQVTIAPAKLRPFSKFIMSIGELPTSYLDSLSYAEQVTWFCDYLQNNVIPALNNNASALQEVQNLMTELQTYVSNYFDNLDVQEEINNKLDEMVLDGSLAAVLNQRIDRYILIGDSYVTGTLNGVQYATDGWAKRLKDLMGLDNLHCYIFGDGGAGFTTTGHDGYTFNTLLSSNVENVTDPESITKIVVCGGYNDSNLSNIETAISQFMTIAKTNFPNAKVYCGMISSTSQENSTAKTKRQTLSTVTLPAYKLINKYGGYYLNNCEKILQNYSLMGTDYFHPSIDGYNELARGIMQILETGNYEAPKEVNNLTFTGANGTTITGTISEISYNDCVKIVATNSFRFNNETNPIDISNGSSVTLGKLDSKFLRKTYNSDLIINTPMNAGSSHSFIQGALEIDDNGNLIYHGIVPASGGNTSARIFVPYFEAIFPKY